MVAPEMVAAATQCERSRGGMNLCVHCSDKGQSGAMTAPSPFEAIAMSIVFAFMIREPKIGLALVLSALLGAAIGSTSGMPAGLLAFGVSAFGTASVALMQDLLRKS